MESFFKWLNKQSKVDSSTEADFVELKEIWDVAGNRKKIETPNKEVEWKKIENRLPDSSSQGRQISMKFVAKVAASLIFIITSSAIIYMSVFSTDSYQSHTDTKLIVLSDGSEVLLNKNSELIVESMFNTFSRNVSLNGEAYFTVTKAKHPFIISTAVSQIKVVGTEFNVKARSKKVELAVNEGIVDFSNINDTTKKIRVHKGYLSTCLANELPKEPLKLKFNDYPGWKHGKLYFQDNSLSEICDELELSYDIAIEISVDSIKENMVSGILEGSNPDELMQILCSLIQLEYKVEQGKYVIY